MAEQWFFPTRQEVTGAPAVDESQLYFGDWSGRVYAVDRATGTERWTYDIEPQPLVYAGQITASPSLAEIDGRPVVIVGGARSLVALDRANGAEVWRHTIGNPADPDDRTEIEGAAAVAGDIVVVGFDVHNRVGQRAGVLAVDLRTGQQRWYRDFEEGRRPSGCGDVWGAVAIDLEAGRASVGTANCPRPENYGPYTEAIVALSLADGSVQWAYQPHEQGSNAGLGLRRRPQPVRDRRAIRWSASATRTASFYVVDRTTGKLVWKTEAQRQAATATASPSAGSSAPPPSRAGWWSVAPPSATVPCVHGFDAATGELLWQNNEPSGQLRLGRQRRPTWRSSPASTRPSAPSASTDGRSCGRHPLRAVSSSGPAIAGRDLYIGVGFREPGTDIAVQGGRRPGVPGPRRGRAGRRAVDDHRGPDRACGDRARAVDRAMRGEPCDLRFDAQGSSGRQPTRRSRS